MGNWTWYDILVPGAALAVALGGLLVIHLAAGRPPKHSSRYE